MTTPSLPTSGFYADMMSSFFGNLSTSQQQALWGDFLQENGLTTNPSATDATAQTLFVSYVNSQYSDNTTLVLSPEEVAKRNVMLSTFQIVLKMLNTLQNSVSTQTANLLFLQHSQEQYTKMMSKVPIYVSDPLTTISPDTTDPSQFRFGYNNISAQDIAEYVSSDPANTITLAGTTGDNSYQLVIQFTQSTVSFAAVSNFGGTNPNYYPSVTVTPSSDPQTLANNISSAFLQLMQQPLVLGLPVVTFLQGAKLALPWRFIQPYPTIEDANVSQTTKQEHQTINTNVAKARAEVNTRSQTYIENARAQRQVLSDTATIVNNNLSQTREALNQQANLLNAIITSMQGLISATFKA